jgi:hypothetical protein
MMRENPCQAPKTLERLTLMRSEDRLSAAYHLTFEGLVLSSLLLMVACCALPVPAMRWRWPAVALFVSLSIGLLSSLTGITLASILWKRDGGLRPGLLVHLAALCAVVFLFLFFTQ